MLWRASRLIATSCGPTTRSSSRLRPGAVVRAMATTTESLKQKKEKRRRPLLRPWPQPIIESNGDYTRESYLEHHIGGPLYGHQTKLPSLPVPSLGDTVTRFLPTALPLATTPTERTQLVKDCDDFIQQAEILQKRLIERQQVEAQRGTSWLQLWWNQLGYLALREPVVVNISYFFQLPDDPTLPEPTGTAATIDEGRATETYLHIAPDGDYWIGNEIFAAKHLQPDYVRTIPLPDDVDVDKTLGNIEDEEEKLGAMQRAYDEGRLPDCMLSAPSKQKMKPILEGNESLLISRGAAALTALADYRHLVCSGSLPQETIGRNQTPLCSVAFKYMFHSCRIPKKDMDSFKMYDPSIFRHVVVVRKGLFYKMEFVDDDDEPLDLEMLEEGLREVVKRADEASRSTSGNGRGGMTHLGWLTTSDRDTWASNRQLLLDVGGTDMEDALATLEGGAMLLCLDDSNPLAKRRRGLSYWHGGTESGGNRWFDKSLQLVVAEDGKCGLIGEHSMADGMPAVGLSNHIRDTTYEIIRMKERAAADDSIVASSGGYIAKPRVEHIFEKCMPAISSNSQILDRINVARDEFAETVENNALQVQNFCGYGSTYIKSIGYSPDAYVQQAIQLATYRLFGEQCATYESTQVRPFLHGRTETTRSVSPESAAFVKRMGLRPIEEDSGRTEEVREEKREFLNQAAASHGKYIRDAAQGFGVDRHFLGLSMLLKDKEEAPSLFSNPLFNKSKRWVVSTSTLPVCPGFGPVVDDGVGIAYDIKPTRCVFTVTSRRETRYSEPLAHLLEEALLEMRDLHVDVSPRSKL